MDIDLLWRPLLEGAAQTFVGALGSYSLAKIANRLTKSNTFDGAMDIWHRGIHAGALQEGDSFTFDGLISPYTQLFPGDPFENAKRWNSLYSFEGKLTSAEYQSIEFFAGSDAALRIGSLNGETIVGLYARYGFVGEGMIGIAPTRLLERQISDFFHPDFVGTRARIKGVLARCPSQHGYIAQAIAKRAGVEIDLRGYKHMYYAKIKSVKPYRTPYANTSSLLGSVWAATELPSEQYLVQYGYLSNRAERQACIGQIVNARAWNKARVYCDDLDCPDPTLTFKGNFL